MESVSSLFVTSFFSSESLNYNVHWLQIPPRESLKQTLFQAHAKMQQYQQQQQMAMNAIGELFT